MKTVVLSAPAVATAIPANVFCETESGLVDVWDGTGAIVGVSQSGRNPADPLSQSGPQIGLVKLGLITIEAAAGTYNFGAALEAATASRVTALASGQQIGTAAETKTLAAPGPLRVYVNIA